MGNNGEADAARRGIGTELGDGETTQLGEDGGEEAGAAAPEDVALSPGDVLSLVDNAPDVLSRFDRELRYLYINKTAERATGIPRGAFIGKTFRELGFPEEICALWEASVRRTFATGQVTRTDFSLPLPGGVRHFEGTCVAERGPDGTIQSVLTVTHDITARIQAEDERASALAKLSASEERLLRALDAARMGTWDWEVATGRLTWVGNLEEIHGMVPGSFDGRFETYIACIFSDDRDAVLADISRAQAEGGPFHVEFRVSYPDGSIHWVAGDGRAECDSEGRPVRMVGVGWDVTPQRTAAAALAARAEREALLNRIGEALRADTEPERVLQAAVTALGEALGADRCFYTTYDLPRDRTRVEAEWNAPGVPPLAGEYVLADLGVRPELAYVGTSVVAIADVRAPGLLPPRAVAALDTLGLRSGAAVALRDGGRLVATLNVAMASKPRDWTADEIALVEAVAAQTRSALEAARVRERERNIAQQLQAALRPAVPRGIPGLEMDGVYQPALDEAQVGGDFYDVFALEKGCYALVVADLSGKGLAAAAQVATVRHMLRAFLYLRQTTVAEAVTMLNDLIAEHDLLTGFATLFVGAYDVNARTLTYVSCGQEPALIRRAASGWVEELGPTGPILGAIPGARYEERVLPLAPGDILAVFTDGLTESGPTRKDLLGVPGVASAFRRCCEEGDGSAADVMERLMQRVEAFAAPTGVRDDVCLLVARVG